MQSIVAKGSNYSSNDIKVLEESNHQKDCGLTLIYPTGQTRFIHCNYNTLKIVTDYWDKTIIYQESYED